jgi:molybdopterin-binding protein
VKYGARNQLQGKVTEIKEGSIMSEAVVELDSGAIMTSVMTMDSLKDLDLKKGDQVKLVVKAVNVLLVKE